MNENSNDETQYLVRTSDGVDHARIEQWEGGKSAADYWARMIGGYVVTLDKYLCIERDDAGEPMIMADYRVKVAEVTHAYRTGKSSGGNPINHGPLHAND